jgi:hypothetical protein
LLFDNYLPLPTHGGTQSPLHQIVSRPEADDGSLARTASRSTQDLGYPADTWHYSLFIFLPGQHGSGQTIPDLAYYRSELSAVVPAPPGATARVDPAGEWLELATTGPAEVVVLGYTREPYLRIKAGVVEENQLSQTTYLNRSLFADSVPTGQDSGGLAPAWKQIGSTGVVRWHDHRIHWMGQERPPAVRADPRHPHPWAPGPCTRR